MKKKYFLVDETQLQKAVNELKLPAFTVADAGKVLAIKSDGSGLEWVTPSSNATIKSSK